MSRFEQRRDMSVSQMLADKKVKVPAGNAVVHLENVGDTAALTRQKNLYWKEGYDQLHSDDTGIFMGIPRDEAAKNEKRYHTEADDRLKRPASAGLDREFDEKGNTAGYAEKQSAEEFLESAD